MYLLKCAKNKERIHTIFSAIDVAYDASQTRVQTSVLNDILMDAQMRNPAPNFNGGRIKILYGSQVAIEPPTFVLFTNNENYMHFSYKRYIENRLRENAFLLKRIQFTFIDEVNNKKDVILDGLQLFSTC